MNEQDRHGSRSGGSARGARVRSGGSARPLPRPATPPSSANAGDSAGRPARPGAVHLGAASVGRSVPEAGPAPSRTPRAPRPGSRSGSGSGPESFEPSPSGSAEGAPRRGRRRLSRRARLARTLAILALVLLLAWPTGLALWANSRIAHTDALSGAADTPGTTYLIAGADIAQGEAQRTDTLMLLHKAPNGRSYLVSIPRDTLVDIPGHGGYKINAAYAFGGAPLLVKTMESFTGLTIDHFIVIGFDGVEGIVNSVGHVNLCIDRDVDDPKSGLVMTEGCHDVAGDQALAFVRARAFDPTADIGRQQRQQQFVGSLMNRVASPGVLLNPISQVNLVRAGTDAVVTDEKTGLIDLSRAVLTMRSAMKDGTNLQMPIKNPAFMTKHSGVAVQVDDAEIDAFFRAMENGSAEAPAQ